MLSREYKALEKRYQKITEWLERPEFSGFTKDDLFIMQFIKKGWGQDIAALSNMAEMLSNIASQDSDRTEILRPLFIEVVMRARHNKVSPYRKDPSIVKNLNHYGYYLEHLNIILGLYELTYRDGNFSELHHRVSQYLHDESMAQSNGHARLIPYVTMRWSADQAGILHSLWLHDRCYGTSLATSPMERWRAHMDSHMVHPETGLYATEVMGVKPYSKEPRGCAIAYLCHYSHSFAPDLASKQWRKMNEHLGQTKAGLYGFREYLQSYSGRWSPDSGPIIAGTGVAATGLGLKAASTLDDQQTYEKLRKSVAGGMSALHWMGNVPGVNRLALIGNDLLASSIYASALSKNINSNQLAESDELVFLNSH